MGGGPPPQADAVRSARSLAPRLRPAMGPRGIICRNPPKSATKPPKTAGDRPRPQELLEAERDVKAALEVEPGSADLAALSKRVK
jgi:hypothetical protein